MRLRSSAGFTLMESMTALGVFSVVSVGLMALGLLSTRLIARNLATNHTHEAMRISGQSLLHDLHEAASPFRLVQFDGTTYADVTATPSADLDLPSQQFASTRANGVRYRRLAGGPYRLAANTTPTSTSLTFEFGVNGALPYVPQAGDKLVVPLIAREYDIRSVTTLPTLGNTRGTVVITDSTGIGFTIDATIAGNVTTAYFYRAAAFTVFQNQLRYHGNFTGTARASYRVVRDKVTSPRPFALLFPSATAQTDALNLRVSLEFYDSAYTARRFNNGTTTLQAIIPPRTIPTPVSFTNAS